MKTPCILTLLAAALFCAASPQSSPAADVVVDISSFAPREPEFILRQIELNVAIKQYEKVLMELPEARMQLTMGPTESGLTDDQKKEWRGRAENKLRYLEETAENLRERIRKLVNEANEMARQLEKDRAPEKAKPKADTSKPEAQNPG